MVNLNITCNLIEKKDKIVLLVFSNIILIFVKWLR